jgi:hypothetical protein
MANTCITSFLTLTFAFSPLGINKMISLPTKKSNCSEISKSCQMSLVKGEGSQGNF